MDDLDDYTPDVAHPESYKATNNPKNKNNLKGTVPPNKERRMQTESLADGSYEESDFVFDAKSGKVIVPGHNRAFAHGAAYSPGSPPAKEKRKNLKKHRPVDKPMDDTAML